MPKQCAVISDSDPSESEIEDFTQSNTAQSIRQLENDRVRTFFSSKTFEWDLALANLHNRRLIDSCIKSLRPRKGAEISKTMYVDSSQYASAVLESVKKIKGPFAQELASQLKLQPEAEFNVPQYLKDAFEWVAK